MQERYDAVVLGGGPAGLAAAITLRRRTGLRVLVVDGGVAVRERPGESAPPQLYDLMRQLGLGSRFLEDGHSRYPGNISVWGDSTPAYKDAIFSALGGPWRLHRARFDALLANAATAAGTDLAWCTAYTGSKALDDGNGFLIGLLHRDTSTKRQVEARFVIDATGASARFARDRCARRIVHDRLYVLGVFAPAGDSSMGMRVMIEAATAGWWYAARLPERMLVMKVMERPLARLMWQDLRAWEQALAQTLLIGKYAAPASGSRHLFPVHSSLLDRMEGPGWIATGDAAACYDPLVAQGLHKSLADGIRAGAYAAATLSGDATEPGYESGIRSRYHEYWEHRSVLYQQEERWPEAPFWKNRRAATAIWPERRPGQGR